MVRLLPTPNTMDKMPPHTDWEELRRAGRGGYANLRDVIGGIGVNGRFEGSATGWLPTPNARDEKGHNQRRNQDCLEGATAFGMDVGRSVDWGRFAPAIHRWERVLGRPAPCPTEVTGMLRSWAAGARPEWFDPCWLKRHAPQSDGRVRLDQPERERVLRRWRAVSDGSDLIPAIWRRIGSLDPERPLPSLLLPAPCVLDYWRDMRGGRAITAAHLSPRFSEWMMGLPDGWVTDPDMWRGKPGNHRNLQLRLCGNGVVPAQAAYAIRWALGVRGRMNGGTSEHVKE